MIGLVIRPGEEAVVREFFELFKTPWEMARPAGKYAVLVCTRRPDPGVEANLVLRFGTNEADESTASGAVIVSGAKDLCIGFENAKLPLYGECLTFPGEAFAGVVEFRDRRSVAVATRLASSTRVWVGFDLFREVRHLLTAGQPETHAAVPALELHIALLRHLILSAGIPLVEIPPVPCGYSFMACLTHDVDHPILRRHCCDHTLGGFLYRATIGSVVGALRGRLSPRRMFRNWGAALSLPLLHGGLVRDLWRTSLLAYAELERGLGSTFFVIPFRGRPGRARNGRVFARRSSPYEPADIAGELRQLQAAGCEVAVHGLDAWCDPASGRAERDQISVLTNAPEVGVRMHWLYFDENSPALLEAAGYAYDSTVGFNQTVGFRAGTAQAYRPLNATHLLELPLHVMDTSLFYPCYLGLSCEEAKPVVGALMDQTVRFGGALTINWHDRSIAPERLWDDFYLWLLGELKRRGAWFPAARQAVAWFRKRRSVTFESVAWEAGTVKIRTRSAAADPAGPPLQLRIHRPGTGAGGRGKFVDVPFQTGEWAIAV